MTKKKSPILTNEQYQSYFDSHYQVDEDSGCYLWQAAKNNLGYGMFRFRHGMATAHRVQMDLQGHNIDGKVVFHTCDNYNCVNPDHLKVGTLKDKAQSVVKKGRAGTIFTDPKYLKRCPHCGKAANPAVYGHSHGDRCKHKPSP